MSDEVAYTQQQPQVLAELSVSPGRRYFGVGVLAGLAVLLLRMALAGADCLEGADALVPVPLHWRRLLARRYNQSALLGAALALIFLYYSLEATLVSAARGSMVRQTLVFPEWWALAVMPFSMAFIAIEFVRRALRRRDHRQMIGL